MQCRDVVLRYGEKKEKNILVCLLNNTLKSPLLYDVSMFEKHLSGSQRALNMRKF